MFRKPKKPSFSDFDCNRHGSQHSLFKLINQPQAPAIKKNSLEDRMTKIKNQCDEIAEFIETFSKIFEIYKQKYLSVEADKIKYQLSHMMSEIHEYTKRVNDNLEMINLITQKMDASALKKSRENFYHFCLIKIKNFTLQSTTIWDKYIDFVDHQESKMVAKDKQEISSQNEKIIPIKNFPSLNVSSCLKVSDVSREHSSAEIKLRDNLERLSEIEDIERKVRSLSNLYEVCTSLISQQGDLVNNIEQQVNSAKHEIKQGHDDLEEARDHQRMKCTIL